MKEIKDILVDSFIAFYGYSKELTDRIKEKFSSKCLRYLFLFMCVPYIIIKGVLCFLYENLIGRFIVESKIAEDRKRSFEYELGFVAIVKNEGDYIREWIVYHNLICDNKTKFYIYDNESEDNLEDILADYIKLGMVEYIHYPGYRMQMKAYDDAIRKYSSECRYMAFIDIDEFIQIIPKDIRLIDEINRLFSTKKWITGIALNWAIFGSSNHETKTEGLVIERFVNRAENSYWGNEHIKTIANPRMVKKYISCHYPKYYLGGWSISVNAKKQHGWIVKPACIDKIRLNHYFGKSREEFVKKRGRGRAASGGCYVDFDRYNEYDRNEIHDETMLVYVDTIRQLI